MRSVRVRTGASLSRLHSNIFVLDTVALPSISAGNESLSSPCSCLQTIVRALFREDQLLIGDAHLRSIRMYLWDRKASALP